MHTHINIFSSKDHITLELTFSKHVTIYNGKRSQYEFNNLDFPNHPNYKNIKIYIK